MSTFEANPVCGHNNPPTHLSPSRPAGTVRGGERLPVDLPAVKDFLIYCQDHFCQALADLDKPHSFTRDTWQRPEGGEGRTHVLTGDVIEKCGVNFSHIRGDRLPPAATAARAELAGCRFEALGLSVIVHPRNPFVPTTHFNLRFFLAEKEQSAPIWWFGGGFDLTPYYGFVEDCQHWHQTAKKACDAFGVELYPRFKRWADDYFYLKHRQEHRGIGGLFFDDLRLGDFEHSFAFARAIGEHFLQAYLPIFFRRMDHPYQASHRDFQSYRRGRYAEFNLIYDRGTLFGLQFGGRVESILVSLPPEVHWRYDWHPTPHSHEARLLQEFLSPRDWIEARAVDNTNK